MPFIPTMLCSRLERVTESCYIAEPKIDIAYKHPRDGTLVEIRQAIRVRRDKSFSLNAGKRAELVCWGAMPSGMLRHPLFVRWLG